MDFTPERLQLALAGFPAASGYLIAYSGGLDSTVLLQAMACLQDRLTVPLAAVHIDHGLLPGAAAWIQHCKSCCRQWNIPLTVISLGLKKQAGRSLEAQARAARYEGISRLVRPGWMLLTAHQQNDQAETLLLQLLRGSGPSGLAAMPSCTEFAEGFHGRPLLSFSREQLQRYAEAHALSWVEDPSNRLTSFDRNYLRHEVLPKIQARWTAYGATLSRSARHLAEAQDIVDRFVRSIFPTVVGSQPETLSVSKLRELEAVECRAVIRHWIKDMAGSVPDTRRLQRIIDEVLPAAADRNPLVAWGQRELRRHQDDLFLLSSLPAVPLGWSVRWLDQTAIELPPGLGRLTAERVTGEGIAQSYWDRGPVEVRFRRGGERCKPADRVHGRDLKRLLQEAGIPPWIRQRLPLVFIDDVLAAVPGQWICQPFAAAPGEPGVSLGWRDYELAFKAK